MKLLTWFVRLFTGIVFVVSGLIKLNDPVGFSFKLEEYFSPGVFDMVWLEPMALTIALIIVIVEVFLGVMLILGHSKKCCLYSLLAMIVFFAFLTFYSAMYDKVTDCGCFGDAIKLTTWQSFWKDITLLIFVIFLLWQRPKITPLGNFRFGIWVWSGTLGVCMLIAIIVLRHLPIIDFRPYKIGVNIYEDMQIPEGSPENIYQYTWTFKNNEKTKEIITTGDYPDEEGEMIGVETALITKGYNPPIHDFVIDDGKNDLTTAMLSKPRLVMFISYDTGHAAKAGFMQMKRLSQEAYNQGYEVIALTASSREVNAHIKAQNDLDFDLYFTDRTTLKTIVRANPGLLVLHQGTIVQKLHYNDFDSVALFK